MKKLLELQAEYIAALKRETRKSVELLTAAKYAMSNNIADCRITGCTAESKCNVCRSWAKVWEDIDAYIEDNED